MLVLATVTRISLAALAASLAVACAPCAPPSPPPSPPPVQVAPVQVAPAQAAPSGPVALVQPVAEDSADYVFSDPNRRAKLASAFPAIDALGQDAIQSHGVPGVSIGVVVDGQLAYANGFGFTDDQTMTRPGVDTQYRIASLTKAFTALSVLALRDDGVLSLDEPLARLLPEAAGLVYPTPCAPITLRQILSHTSGLPRDGSYPHRNNNPSEQEILGSLPGVALESPPGTGYAYSNLGYQLLGLAVGRAARVPLRTFVQNRIFLPLGMTSTTFDGRPPPAGRLATGYAHGNDGMVRRVPGRHLGAAEGSGGIVSTVRDLARWVAFQLDAYPSRSAPEAGPVRRSTVRETHASAPGTDRRLLRHVAMNDDANGEELVEARASSYGFAWVVRQTRDFDLEVLHNGDTPGFTSAITLLPHSGVGVIVLENMRGGHGAGAIAADVVRALQRTGGLAPRVPRMQPPPPSSGR